MDISKYISELLYEHDCVIIPGFGGFICNYQPAQINRRHNTISPPSKAVSFNVNLQSNDGLLINYITRAEKVSFEDAQDIVATWLSSSKSLLRNNEDLILRNIGAIFSDEEGSLQFVPDDSVNYSKSSYGLKTIIAAPIYREKKKIIYAEKPKSEFRITERRRRLAATVFLLAVILTLINLMLAGVEIKPLVLDEASVFNFITHIAKSTPDMKPMPVEVETSASVADTAVKKQPVPISFAAHNALPQTSASKPSRKNFKGQSRNRAFSQLSGYYVITGAYAEDKNVEAAEARLLQRFPASQILVEKSRRLTRLGYAVGGNEAVARMELKRAQTEDAKVWLLEK